MSCTDVRTGTGFTNGAVRQPELSAGFNSVGPSRRAGLRPGGKRTFTFAEASYSATVPDRGDHERKPARYEDVWSLQRVARSQGPVMLFAHVADEVVQDPVTRLRRNIRSVA